MLLDDDSWRNKQSLILVKDFMNTSFEAIHANDSVRTALRIFSKYKLDVLPVVDDGGRLQGVLSNRKLSRALAEGLSLDEPCAQCVVENPIYISSEQTYDDISLVMKLHETKVGNVPVVDTDGNVVGVAGPREYVRTTLGVIVKAYSLLESIFQSISEGIITVDETGSILRVNDAVEKILGINKAYLVGRNITELSAELNSDSRSTSGKKLTILGVNVFVKQAPIIENQHNIGANYVLLDITDLETIAEELQIVKNVQNILHGIINTSSDGVVVTDRFGSVKYVNEMATNLLGKDIKMIACGSVEEYLNLKSLELVSKTGIAEVEVCRVNDRNCIVSHVPIRNDDGFDNRPLGVISTVYLDDNKLTEELTRKWFSLQQQVRYYREELERKGGTEVNSFAHILSDNQDFINIKQEAQKIARSTSTVLLTGESGVGKDMFARAIHAASPRKGKPFVKVNSVAIPESLFESELFGYAPGSFTGASKKGKPGYFELADKGTIFLDEIGDMPLSIQVKILQVIQEKEFTRVGGVAPQSVDVRIIAATNRNLREAVNRGHFREDLYYRLNVIELHLPPLRARSEDILSLAEGFIEKYNAILGTRVRGITKRAKEVLQQYAWPGNIRELENAMERAANFVWEGEIDIEHLPININNSKGDANDLSSYQVAIDEVNKEIIQEALSKARGNKSAAARMLKISRSSFYEKLAKYGIK